MTTHAYPPADVAAIDRAKDAVYRRRVTSETWVAVDCLLSALDRATASYWARVALLSDEPSPLA